MIPVDCLFRTHTHTHTRTMSTLDCERKTSKWEYFAAAGVELDTRKAKRDEMEKQADVARANERNTLNAFLAAHKLKKAAEGGVSCPQLVKDQEQQWQAWKDASDEFERALYESREADRRWREWRGVYQDAALALHESENDPSIL